MYIVDNTNISPQIVKYLIMIYKMCFKKEKHFFQWKKMENWDCVRHMTTTIRCRASFTFLMQSADLMVWTPKGSNVLKIPKDPSWKSNVDKLIKFYFNTFLDLF